MAAGEKIKYSSFLSYQLLPPPLSAAVGKINLKNGGGDDRNAQYIPLLSYTRPPFTLFFPFLWGGGNMENYAYICLVNAPIEGQLEEVTGAVGRTDLSTGRLNNVHFQFKKFLLNFNRLAHTGIYIVYIEGNHSIPVC